MWRSSMESRLQKKEMNTSDRKRTGRPLFPSTVKLIFKSASVLRYGYIVLSFYDFLISDAREEKFEVQSQLFGGQWAGPKFEIGIFTFIIRERLQCKGDQCIQ